MILKTIFVGVVAASALHAAPNKNTGAPIHSMATVPAFNPDIYNESNKKWKESERKVANEYTSASPEFNEIILRPWLATKTSEGVSKLLTESFAKYDTYKAPDVKYFLAQMHTMIPLKGIIWRMRPLFEVGGKFNGNRMTHMSAIQLVRNAVTGLSAAFPTKQTDAMIGYFTKPGPEMTEKSQFRSMVAFQNFLVNEFAQAQIKAATRISELERTYADAAPWVWDNKIFYGTASFRDGLNQFVGHGSAERHVMMGTAWEAVHDAYVFSAYNQNELISLAGKLGRSFGIDVLKSEEWDERGLTDEERLKIVRSYAANSGFLELRGSDRAKNKDDKKDLGVEYMKQALDAKKWAVHEFNQAYLKIKNRDAAPSRAINPILFQSNVQNRLDAGVTKMVSAMAGETEFLDPVSSMTVKINVPNFYNNPPKSLTALMANGWESHTDNQPITGNDGKPLQYRNYFSGRSNSWNNNEWSKYVTTAKGKEANYMMTAKRVLHYSVGAMPVFGAVDILVR